MNETGKKKSRNPVIYPKKSQEIVKNHIELEIMHTLLNNYLILIDIHGKVYFYVHLLMHTFQFE